MNRCRGRQSSREPDILERKRARGTLLAGRKARARHHMYMSKRGSQLPRRTAAQEQPEEEGREKVRERERERERESERERASSTFAIGCVVSYTLERKIVGVFRFCSESFEVDCHLVMK